MTLEEDSNIEVEIWISISLDLILHYMYLWTLFKFHQKHFSFVKIVTKMKINASYLLNAP